MPLLTTVEAAARRKTTKFSIHRWIKAGLRAQRIGRDWLIDQADLDAFTPRRVGNPAFGRRRKPQPGKTARN